jgi:hypothetical protein
MPNETLEQIQVTHFKPAGGFTTIHDKPGTDPTVLPGSGNATNDPYLEPLTVGPYRSPPLTCGDRCDEEEKLARVHCDAIRKRVQQWMKDSVMFKIHTNIKASLRRLIICNAIY